MLKKILVVAVSLFSLVSLTYAQVEIVDSGEKEVEGNLFGNKLTRTDRTISVKNQGPVSYGFRYSYYLDPSIKGEKIIKPLPKHVGFPCIGDITTGTGLGLTGGAWYSNGFLGIRMNGKLLNRTIAKEFKVLEQDGRGVVDVLWEPEWAKIKAKFVFLPGDDKVYTEVTIEPREEVDSLELRLLCIPGWHKAPLDRWLSTSKRSIQLSGENVSLNPKEEPWIFYFDTKSLDINGTCAVMYLPEEIKKIEVSGKSTPHTILSLSPEVRKIHLIFWNFPGSYKNSGDAYQYLKEKGPEMLEKLRKFNFKDVEVSVVNSKIPEARETNLNKSDAREWKIKMSSQSFSVDNKNIYVDFLKKCAWTIGHIRYKGDEIVGKYGANGCVVSGIKNGKSIWIGTGHGLEEVNSLVMMVDGNRKEYKKDLTYSGKEIRILKESKLGPFMHTMEVYFPSSGNHIIERNRYKIKEDLKDKFVHMYAFMHCTNNEIKNWLALLENNEIIEGKADKDDKKFLLRKDIKSLICYSESRKKGVVYLFPEIYQGTRIKNAIWDRTGDNKFYFNPKVKGMGYKVEDEFEYRIKLIPFTAELTDWKETGKTLSQQDKF